MSTRDPQTQAEWAAFRFPSRQAMGGASVTESHPVIPGEAEALPARSAPITAPTAGLKLAPLPPSEEEQDEDGEGSESGQGRVSLVPSLAMEDEDSWQYHPQQQTLVHQRLRKRIKLAHLDDAQKIWRMASALEDRPDLDPQAFWQALGDAAWHVHGCSLATLLKDHADRAIRWPDAPGAIKPPVAASGGPEATSSEVTPVAVGEAPVPETPVPETPVPEAIGVREPTLESRAEKPLAPATLVEAASDEAVSKGGGPASEVVPVADSAARGTPESEAEVDSDASIAPAPPTREPAGTQTPEPAPLADGALGEPPAALAAPARPPSSPLPEASLASLDALGAPPDHAEEDDQTGGGSSGVPLDSAGSDRGGEASSDPVPPDEAPLPWEGEPEWPPGPTITPPPSLSPYDADELGEPLGEPMPAPLKRPRKAAPAARKTPSGRRPRARI